ADAMKMKSIAFPVLASGHNGFDLNLALEIAIKSIEAFSSSEIEEATVVVFGNKIAGIASEKGYEVGVLPRDIAKDEKEFQKKKKAEKKFENAKNAVQDFAVGQIEGWTDYFKNPENRRKASDMGAEVAGLVIKIAKKVL
ncbi:MAG: hypothetical protein IKO32_07650, partial [Lachnospiraceae bacterium]|nr:hypothetical protein [Lachnospiraceae bacterium]